MVSPTKGSRESRGTKVKIKRVTVLAAMVIATLGLIVPFRFANTTRLWHHGWAETPTPCNHYNSTTYLPYYGGTYYCKYGYLTHQFPNEGSQQAFVIGTDFSVWTKQTACEWAME